MRGMKIAHYKELIVWQKAMDLVVHIYGISHTFPTEERFGLTAQMRRCAVSIPSNIAEGSRRVSKKDFHKFLLIAFGSGAELETHIEIAFRLTYFTQKEYDDIEKKVTEVMKMLNKLQSVLKE